MIDRIRELVGSSDRRSLLRAIRGAARRRIDPEPPERHLEATYRWLCAAQDASADGGVAGHFDLWNGRWSASYPETTGYIIPTFLSLAEAGVDPSARGRAQRMADWSCEVQMDDGAVLSGLLGTEARPAVFNTGQAMFGWVSAYQVFGHERYADAARRAGRWLVSQQDADGAWRRNLSALTSAPVHTYNGRCGWALAYAAEALAEPEFADAARRAGDWVLGQQNQAGWFANNGFATAEVPLLHTISYVIEGLIGTYAFTREERYLVAARSAVDPLVAAWRAGRLAGRLDERWQPTARWRCVTGDAQVAIVLWRLHGVDPSRGYADVARRLTAEVSRVQRTLTGGSGVAAAPGPSAGGVPGSFPIWGQYMRFALPNWAAKFHLDALLLQVCQRDEFGFPGLTADA